VRRAEIVSDVTAENARRDCLLSETQAIRAGMWTEFEAAK